MRLIRGVLILSLCTIGGVAAAVAANVQNGWVAAVVLLALVCARRAKAALTAYGTARWCSSEELDAKGMLEGNGLLLGLVQDRIGRFHGIKLLFDRRVPANRAVRRCLLSLKRKKRPALVRLNHAVHTAVFAPSGAGKSVSIVITHVLTCPDPMVVIDPKGELYRTTATARRRAGHRVVRIDPFGVISNDGGDTFNVLAHIDPESDRAPDEIRSVANSAVVRTGKEEPFWSDAAESEIALAIAFALCFGDPEDRNLQAARRVLSDEKRRSQMIEFCLASDKWGGLLARWAGQAAQLKGKTLDSVMAHVHTHMRFLDTIPVMRNTVSGSFDPKELFGRMTIYLILPPDLLRAQAGLLRLWIGSLLTTCVKNGAQEKKLVRFVLDEAAALGKLDCLSDALEQYRGYGVRLLFIYQSTGQLKKCWGEGQDQTFLANVSAIYFGVVDQQTAEAVSARLGEYTNIVGSGSRSEGGSSSRSSGNSGSSSTSSSWNTSDNWSQAARKLLTADEVIASDPRMAITFTPGLRPICTRLVRFYEGIPDTQMSLFEVVVDTACICLCALLLAAMTVATFCPQALR